MEVWIIWLCLDLALHPLQVGDQERLQVLTILGLCLAEGVDGVHPVHVDEGCSGMPLYQPSPISLDRVRVRPIGSYRQVCPSKTND